MLKICELYFLLAKYSFVTGIRSWLYADGEMGVGEGRGAAEMGGGSGIQ